MSQRFVIELTCTDRSAVFAQNLKTQRAQGTAAAGAELSSIGFDFGFQAPRRDATFPDASVPYPITSLGYPDYSARSVSKFLSSLWRDPALQ